MKILGVITARGGSKGLHRKNVRPMLGVPLIEYTINAAIEVKSLFQRIIVSTDDIEIANVARNAGADVPFLRPEKLATDSASSVSVVKHALEFLEKEGEEDIDWVLILQPTSPLRNSRDIESIISLAKSADCDSVVSVWSVNKYHPMKMKTITDEGYITPYIVDAREPNRRQELSPSVFLRNGALYLVRKENVMSGDLYGERILPYEMPPERSIDIDDEFDFMLAENLMRCRQLD